MTKKHMGDSTVERAVIRDDVKVRHEAQERVDAIMKTEGPKPTERRQRLVHHCRQLPAEALPAHTDMCWACPMAAGSVFFSLDCIDIQLGQDQPEKPRK